MPKYEVTLEGVRMDNYSYTTIIEADCLDEAWDKAEEMEPRQEDWEHIGFDDVENNQIEVDGVEDVVEIEVTEEGKGFISYQAKEVKNAG